MAARSCSTSCRATLVGNRLIVMGGLGSRLWSCKEVSPTMLPALMCKKPAGLVHCDVKI